LGWVTLNWAQINKASEKWIHPDFILFFCQGHHFFKSNADPISEKCWHAMTTLGRISNFKLMFLSNENLF
jgi:hypothetical protein